MEDRRLKLRVRKIQERIDMLVKLKTFVENNPELCPRTRLKPKGTGLGLEFEERGFICLRRQGRPTLILEKYIPDDDWTEEKWAERFVSMDDISEYSAEQLANAIKEGINVDITRPPYYYLDEELEEDADE